MSKKLRRLGNRRLNVESLEDRRLLAVVPTGFTETVVASNLTSPTTLDIEDGGRIWVAYQDGRIEVIENDALNPQIAHQLDADGSAEHGLQGIELDPDFETNGYLYVYYTANSPTPHNRLSRLTVDPTTENTIVTGSELVLLELPNLSDYGNPPWHIGGAVHFALDGTIMVQVGESQQSALSQDIESPLGKVLRINADGTLPTDNPFYDAGDGITWKDHVWALGLRNPFGGDLHPETGRYFIADVGAGSWEEINDATNPGLNFGWATTEGAFDPNAFPAFTNPYYTYPHSEDCAITGGAFERGTPQFPVEYQGKYFFSQFCNGEIQVIDPDDPNDVQVFATDAAFPMNIEFAADGSMYYISRGAGAGGAPGIGTGSVRKVQYVADVPPSIVGDPADTLASVGFDAVFSVNASGTAPLDYQWRLNGADIAGATSATLVVSSVSLADDGGMYSVVVTNAFGSATSADATLNVTADTPPTPVIDAPTAATTYRAGDTIGYGGMATDLEDGTLAAADLTWRVDFHHNVHSHPFIPPTSGITGGQFTIPTATETDHDVWYRVNLSATDAAGLTSSTFFDLFPEKSDFVIATNMPGGGGNVTLDGGATTLPQQRTGVVNVERTVEVPASQEIDGTVGFFEQWIDGETSRQRTIFTPEEDTAYVALYRGVTGASVYLSDLPIDGTPDNGWGPLELDTSNGEDVGGDGSTITLNGVTYAKGLGVHAYSEVTYNLGGGYSRFVSDIGVDDETGPGGSVEFQVLADGNEVFASGLMTGSSATQTVNVDVSGVDELKLIVTDGGNGNGFDHADWADARLFTIESTSILLPFSAADATLDGRLDEDDVAALINNWRADTVGETPAVQVAAGDFNFDGTTNFTDWEILRRAWNAQSSAELVLGELLAASRGDFDNSGSTDGADLAAWEQNFGTSGGSVVVIGDANVDGAVSGGDFLAWQRNYDDVGAPQEIVSVADASAARDALLAGVSQIATVGAPGEIAVFDPPGAGAGQGAFGVIHDGNYRQMVAAAIWGSGKIVGFGHNGYTNFDSVGNSLDTGQLYLNSVAWTTGIAGTTPTIVTNNSGTRTWLQSQGFTNVSVHSNWENFLTGADLLVVELGPNISTAKQNAVSNFVQGGGGLITGGTGWGYKQNHDLITLDGNEVLRQAGLAWPDGIRTGTTDATNRATELANASRALEFAQQFWAGGGGTTAQQEEAGEALQTVLEILPATHPLAIDIANAFAARAASISATPATPVSNPLDQAILTWEAGQLLATPVGQVTAHHTAEAVYGAIPAGAPRLANHSVSIDTNKTGLLATGMYAAPGDLVTVTLPSSLVGQGYSIRLGGHVDNISSRSSWNRVPFGVSRSFSINSTSVQVASAFGGAIYVDVGGQAAGTAPNLGNVNVVIDGAIAAPHFVLGQTTDAQWMSTIRDLPGPYAEFVSNHVAFSVPSAWIRSLGDAIGGGATELMTYWDDATAFQDFVGGFENLRTGPDRINLDVQISGGLLHAGYPIQGPTSYGASIVDLDALKQSGDWGWFHELGHEMQRHPELGWGYDNPFTFSGDVEVTVNIFANAALELSAPNPPTAGWGWSVYPDEVMSRAISTVNNGGAPNFDDKDPYPFYFQLADGEWDWQGYRDVIGSYVADQQTNPGALPQNNQAEKDQWLIRWSQATGYDMTEYMVDNWALEVSASALNTVAALSLPSWMPLATTIDDFQIDAGNSQVVDTGSGGLGMDGTATFVGIATQPQKGALTDNGNGTHTYQPNVAGGMDSFLVTYQSSAGNTQDFTIDVTIGNGFLPGDVDLDGDLDMDDVTQFIAGWRSDTTGLDAAGKVMKGDLNLDGVTNFADWFILRQASNAEFAASLDLGALLAASSGDSHSDGNLDKAQLDVWEAGFGNAYSGSSFLAWQRGFTNPNTAASDSGTVAAVEAITPEQPDPSSKAEAAFTGLPPIWDSQRRSGAERSSVKTSSPPANLHDDGVNAVDRAFAALDFRFRRDRHDSLRSSRTATPHDLALLRVTDDGLRWRVPDGLAETAESTASDATR